MEATPDVRVGDRDNGTVQAHHHDAEGHRDEGPPRIASHARAGIRGDETLVDCRHGLPRWFGGVPAEDQAALVASRSQGGATRANRPAEPSPTAGGPQLSSVTLDLDGDSPEASAVSRGH